ncbi:hypothetical protein SAMN04489729_4833 [Amycolatopsis lurida]|uniref:Uncharacterized protein n=1 Tax=Amycolatopsis lurida NRRL 2430 TaxID=1460371 RepID=A0A2P2FWE1_AMYLU|nr:hypothetical protein [Amycolatopsis lurida]KFU80995.1 hypothetical protein BB31_11470 [Amycolatopsis lurida NRRL 2430]SED61264.1 hypothetical protein SAMN04489729_4833 [Amycolatopsis lurida]
MTTDPAPSIADAAHELRERFARTMYERAVPGGNWADVVDGHTHRHVGLITIAAEAAVDVYNADMAPTLAVLVEALDNVNTGNAQLLAADGLLETLFGYLANGQRGQLVGEAARRTGWISQRRIDELGERLRAWRASWAPTGSAVS